MTTAFQRARQPEQKEQRRAHLLATARGLLASGVAVRALSLNELARQAKMAKANVYRYFETREALLLALLSEEWQIWFEDLCDEWPTGRRGHTKLEFVVARLARSLSGRELLCQLTAALPTVIEQNLSEAAIVSFKRESLALFRAIASFLAERSPELSEAAYAELLHDAAHAIMGLYPAMNPTEEVARALMAPELKFFRRDFRAEFERMLGALAADHVKKSRRPAVRTQERARGRY